MSQLKVMVIGGGKVNTIGFQLMSQLRVIPGVEFVVVGRSKHDDEYIRMLRGKNPCIREYVACDITQVHLHPLAQRIQAGEFRMVINTAATHGYSPISEIKYRDFSESMDVNLFVPLILTQLVSAADHTVDLVFMSSDAAVKPMTNNMLYNVSKAGLEMLVRQGNRELKDSKLCLHAIRPPHVRDTTLAYALYDDLSKALGISWEEARNKIINGVPQDVEERLMKMIGAFLTTLLINEDKQFRYLRGGVHDYSGLVM